MAVYPLMVMCFVMRWALLLGFGFGLVGCSSFPSEFEEASGVYQRDGADGIEGPWIGSWTSVPTGHEGPLWCLVEPAEAGAYRFRYRAGWGWILRGEFTDDAVAVERDGATYGFEEEMDLGSLGGIYRMKIRANETSWSGGHRSSKGDFGKVEMRRPLADGT